MLSLALPTELSAALRGAEEGLRAHAGRELREDRLRGRDRGATQALRTRAALMPLVRRPLGDFARRPHGRCLGCRRPLPDLSTFLPRRSDELATDATALSRPSR